MKRKTPKNLLLSPKAVARGERLAMAKSTSLSAVVDSQSLAKADADKPADYWHTPTKPIARPGDPRYEYLKRKHR